MTKSHTSLLIEPQQPLTPYQRGKLAYHQRLRAAENGKRPLSGLERAVNEAGGVTCLAIKLGTYYQKVQRWLTRGYPPANYIVEIESEFGIPRRDLLDPRLRDLLDTGLED